MTRNSGPLSEDGAVWGRQLGCKFAEGIRMTAPQIERMARVISNDLRYRELLDEVTRLRREATRIRRFMAMPWYRRWWVMVRGR